MKKKRSSVLLKLDSNFKSKLENLFGGRTQKKQPETNKITNNKKPKRKFKLKQHKPASSILPMPPLPLPPPLPNNNFNIKEINEIEVDKVDKVEKIEKVEENGKVTENQKPIINNNTTIHKSNNSIQEKIIEKLIILNSHLIDREIDKMKKQNKKWWDIEHKSFILGVVTSLLSFIITYLV